MTNKYEYEEDEFSGSGGGRGSKKSTSFSVGNKGSFSNSSAYNSRLSNSNYLAATRSNNPQAMVKVASHVRGSRAKVLMEYISRTDRENGIEVEDELGIMYTGKNDIQEIYDTWSKDFERAKPNAKILPRHVSHLVLSADADTTPENLNKVLDAARKTCNELIGDKGYRFLIGLHQDGGKPHAHIVVKAKSADKNISKVRLGPAELHSIRTSFAKNLSDLGLQHVATLRRDRPKVVEKIKEGKEPLKSKTKNHFTHALSKENSAEYMQAIDYQIVKFRESIKSSGLKNNEKYYLKICLWRYEQSLLKDPASLEKHQSYLIQSFTQYRKMFKEDLSKVLNPPRIRKTISDRDHVDTKIYRDIKKTRADIKTIEDPQKRSKAFSVLNKHCEALIGKPISMLKNKDLPPGEIVNQFINELRKDIRECNEVYKKIEDILSAPGLSSPDKFLMKFKKDDLDKVVSKIFNSQKEKLNKLSLPNEINNRILKGING